VTLLLNDLRAAIEHLGKHPITVPMSAQEAGGFSHL
jgi:glutamate decarboxylase